MNRKPAIIVISSHVVRGTVGNRAAAFALEVLGYPVWTVPTITLPWHPGHTQRAGPATRVVMPDETFATMLSQLASSPWSGEVGGVLSGYLGSAEQAGSVAALVKALKQRNPDVLYMLDPVLGDHGRLYVAEDQAVAIRDALLPLADIATPNPFELSFLAGADMPQRNERMVELARQLAVRTVLVTSAGGMKTGHIGNILLCSAKAHLIEHRRLDGPPNGLGDLTSALFLGHLLAREDPREAARKAIASVYEVMKWSAQGGSDELLLESAIRSLVAPAARIDERLLQIG